LDWAFCHGFPLPISNLFGQEEIMSAPRNPDRFHGRVYGSQRICAHPACDLPGQFRAPNPYGRAPGPNGPGDYLWFCLEHVREFNAGYDWFSGMSADEIAAAQSPLNVWPSETQAFRASGNVDAPPKWADFNDPLDAISARFKGRMEEMKPAMSPNRQMLSVEDQKALKTLGLAEDANRKTIRSAYSKLVRKYHPDKNGGDRSYEKALQDVIAAYTHLKSASAFLL
jgi:DnaJ domain